MTVHSCIIKEDVEALINAIEMIAITSLNGDSGGGDNIKYNKGNEGVLGDWQNLLD